MNLKHIKFISFFTIFILSFLAHFMYDLFPYTFISFFFPVNESIWEHMKILYTCILIAGTIEYILLKKFNISYNNFFLQLFISSYLSIIIYLIIYLTVYIFWGENLIFSIFLMAFVYIIVIVISYFIMNSREFLLFNKLSILFLIFGYIIFIYLTFNPFHNFLFYDSLHKNFGIIK